MTSAIDFLPNIDLVATDTQHMPKCLHGRLRVASGCLLVLSPPPKTSRTETPQLEFQSVKISSKTLICIPLSSLPLQLLFNSEVVTTATMMLVTIFQFKGRLPRQIQRALPVYIACAIILLFLSNIESFGSPLTVTDAFKRELSYQSPLTREGGFPRKIWQTWKVDPLGFEERDMTCARTWTTKNPGHRYEVLTDNNDLYYVESHFGPAGLNRPDIVYMYRSLSARIVKADLLRYLVMYIEGGVYTDIDVEALRPIDRFIPDRYNERDIDMVIGVEIDQPDFSNHTILGPKSQSFCQWTFMCKPRLPVMMRIIDDIIKWLNDVAKRQQVPISDIVLDFDEVITGTGPSAFTGAVLAEMSTRHRKPVTWDYFHNMPESKLVGGVLVLTVEAFAAGQGHSDSGNHNARTALVKHRYHASGWPTKHPRYKHPVYGEVELCNWEVECVKLWDANKAAFEALPPEEQARQIAEKNEIDALHATSPAE
jgi:mannosyltransferase OCH1-like enzyme